MTKLQSLLEALGHNPFLNVDHETLDGNTYVVDGGEYLVLTDSQADEITTERIRESLWAFVPAFLGRMTQLPVEIFEALVANNHCEGNNDALEKLLNATCGLDAFCDAAIEADGRGHFLAIYDFEEIELDGFYAYRTN